MRKRPFQFCPYCRESLSLVVKDFRNEQDVLKSSCTNAFCRYRETDDEGPFVDWNNPVPVAIVIIPHKDGIVLIRRKRKPGKGKIALPGGFVDEGEEPEEAAIREAMEEVNLEIEISRLLLTQTSKNVNQHISVFVAKPVTELPVAGDDAAEAFVCPLGEVPFDELAFTVHEVSLKKWLWQVNTP